MAQEAIHLIASMKRIAFFGTPDFAVPSLNALLTTPGVEVAVVVTQPDRPAGRGKKLQASPVKKRALECSLPVLQPTSIRKEKESFLSQFMSYGPLDGAVVVAFGQILPVWLLDSLQGRFVNVHGSLLPRWRGAAPMQRAIMAGDRETGVCLMKMEAGLDTGPVYTTAVHPIADDDSLASIHDALSLLGGELLKRDIVRILDGKIDAVPQPSEGVTYADKISSDEAKIDWSKSADEVSRLIRGVWPAPGAFTALGGKRLKVIRAVPTPGDGKPGELVEITKDAIVVQCGEGRLSLLELQLEGKQRMATSEFLKGTSLPSGLILGE